MCTDVHFYMKLRKELWFTTIAPTYPAVYRDIYYTANICCMLLTYVACCYRHCIEVHACMHIYLCCVMLPWFILLNNWLKTISGWLFKHHSYQVSIMLFITSYTSPFLTSLYTPLNFSVDSIVCVKLFTTQTNCP